MENLSLNELLTAFGSDSYIPQLPLGWSQGRAIYGGLGAALASCAMRKLLGEGSAPIRSMFITFIAPLPPSQITVTPKLLRQGSSVSLASAEVSAPNGLCLVANAAFGKPRPTSASLIPQKITLPPRRASSLQARGENTPDFLNYFDYDWVGNGIPFSGNKDNDLGIWVKHKQSLQQFPVENILSIADFPPPVVLSHYDKPNVPASSLTWAIDFIAAPEKLSHNEWFYLDFELEQASNGYTQQSGKIYSQDGSLCALSRQCMVYFEPKP